jgi:hypothetical protein
MIMGNSAQSILGVIVRESGRSSKRWRAFYIKFRGYWMPAFVGMMRRRYLD